MDYKLNGFGLADHLMHQYNKYATKQRQSDHPDESYKYKLSDNH